MKKKFSNINPYWKKRLTIVLIVIVTIMAIFCLHGCNPDKELQRKNNKYVNYVNSNAILQLRVDSAYQSTHPKDTTTTKTVGQPKIIYVNNAFAVKDTARERFVIDSMKNVLKADTVIDCGEAAANAYDLGYEECEKYYKSHPIKVECPPDTTTNGVDHTEADRQKAIAANLQLTLSNINGQLTVKNAQISDQKSIIVKMVIGLILLFALLILVLILKFKNIIPNAISSAESSVSSAITNIEKKI